MNVGTKQRYFDLQFRLEEKERSVDLSDIVKPAEKRSEEGILEGVYWEWNNSYSEGDSKIDAPCLLTLDRIDANTGSLHGYMKHCKNSSNPFRLDFQFEIQMAGTSFWAIFVLCKKDLGEGGRCELSPRNVSYSMFSNSSARRDIST